MMGKTAIMKIMERACGHEVNVGDRVWCHVDLASARDFGGANCVLQFEKEMGKDAKVWDPDKIAYTLPRDEQRDLKICHSAILLNP